MAHDFSEISRKISDLKPICDGDADFIASIAALNQALATARLRDHRQTFWLVDHGAHELRDAVSIVDLSEFGNFAIGSANWANQANDIALHDLLGQYALIDVLESVLSIRRRLRLAEENSAAPRL